MKELLHAAVAPANLLPTGVLVFVLLYWLTVMLGLLDFKSLDLDVHTDADVHADVHADAHAGAHGHAGESGTSFVNSVLGFFNLGRVPLMVFVSFVVLPWWVGSILANYYLGNESLLVGAVLLVPLLLGSLLVAKVLTTPFVSLFAAMEVESEGANSPVGKVCTLLLPATHEQLGQASVRLRKGAPLMLNVRAASASAELRKGDTALIIDYDQLHRCYLVEPFEMNV
ncbi:OB-fold-containig protein [Hymenobacter aerophilus]|uniref:OB-fold-containig protein n=1 Tax=Hymenobacter aerophilus TaxID=119644 RepID=UPI000364C392|nr:OB-fold-containig protein [Hymenobacter aerophilus]